METHGTTAWLSLEVVDVVGILIQIECHAIRGDSEGYANAFTQRPVFRALASLLEQFSETLHGPASWEIGAENTSLGLIRLEFSASDHPGRARCQVQLATQSSTNYWTEKTQHFAMELPADARQLRTFAQQLARLAEELQGKVVLTGDHVGE